MEFPRCRIYKVLFQLEKIPPLLPHQNVCFILMENLAEVAKLVGQRKLKRPKINDVIQQHISHFPQATNIYIKHGRCQISKKQATAKKGRPSCRYLFSQPFSWSLFFIHIKYIQRSRTSVGLAVLPVQVGGEFRQHLQRDKFLARYQIFIYIYKKVAVKIKASYFLERYKRSSIDKTHGLFFVVS